MGITSKLNHELPKCEWKMVALVPIPWREFSTKWGISFEENEEWEAPGPVAYASAYSEDSRMWYALEHHFDHLRPGVYFFVPAGTENSIEVLAQDLDLPAEFLVPMRI
ncbi:hypothetical protein [Actinomadura sp. 6K520]|uniref:hypothetical protein n=1 Tax=Actinomadura sp. 6K520 TaxID=2530364 RepID=UPI0010462C17|nr:hypothetical protein [Actinomadura sp. 6K520]TDE21967.1 hypothetical protein E1289_30700 [Actinomadura sp. 6K520]